MNYAGSFSAEMPLVFADELLVFAIEVWFAVKKPSIWLILKTFFGKINLMFRSFVAKSTIGCFTAAKLGLILALLQVGCNDSGGGGYKTAAEAKGGAKTAAKGKDDHGHDHDHGHGHSEPGPHKGTLIEIGEDEFHAELVVDHDAHAVRIYLLGADAKTASTTTDTSLKISFEKVGDAELKAAPQAGETEGKTSCFEVLDDKLVHDLLDLGYAHGKFTVNLGGKAYTASIDAHF